MTAEVWILPNRKQILVTDFPGPPSEICGYVSEEARQAHLARGADSLPTVSEIGFPAELFLGSFEMPLGGGWGEAQEVAEAKAKELGYEVVHETTPFPSDDDDSEDDDWRDWVDDSSEPVVGEDVCIHGVPWNDECEDCEDDPKGIV